jgi:hypothetical protein
MKISVLYKNQHADSEWKFPFTVSHESKKLEAPNNL